MSKYLTFFCILFTGFLFAQKPGIAYQAVIYKHDQKNLPGVRNSLFPLESSKVCLQFTLFDSKGDVEYRELISTMTDQFGLVNVVIGSGIKNGGYASTLNSVQWTSFDNQLLVELDIKGDCTNFEVLSKQVFNATPYALNALTANSSNSVTGIVPILNGGTGADNPVNARFNLGIGNVDNTSDVNKPVSLAVQQALDLKENSSNKSMDIILDQNSNVKYPSVKAVRDYVDERSKIYEAVFIARTNMFQFRTPKPFTDVTKVQVFRNGIRIGLIAVDANNIQLEQGVVCDDNDEIRILQSD